MKYVIGDSAVFQASFYTPTNLPATLDEDPTVAFFDIEDNDALGGAVVDIEQTSPATWAAQVLIPGDVEPGWYKIVWTALINGVPAVGVENFELVIQGNVVINDLERNLRRRLRDTLTDPGDDSGAFFLDEEIHSLLAMNGNDIIGAAYDGWLVRAAFYQDHVDVIESGSDRRMSQMFKNAMAMVEFYRKAKLGNVADKNAAIAGRVVGVVASLRGEYVDTFGLVASARYRASQTQTGYVRIFPLYRFAGLTASLPVL